MSGDGQQMKKGIEIASIALTATVLLLLISSAPNTAGIGSVGGMLTGRVWGYTWLDDPVPLVWARVSAYSGNILVESVSTGANGSYTMYLPSGLLNVTVEHPGFKMQSRIIAISEGGSAQMNFYMERSEIPIPEFEAYLLPIIAAAVLVLAIALTKRKRSRKK